MLKRELMTYRVSAPRSALFPLDMLRYASSWPATAEAAAAIGRSVCGEVTLQKGQRQQIELGTYDDPRTFEFVGEARRWESFGWSVEVMDAAGDYRPAYKPEAA